MSDSNIPTDAAAALRAALQSAENERDALRATLATRTPDREQAIASAKLAQDASAELLRTQDALAQSQTRATELSERCTQLEDAMRALETHRDVLLEEAQTCQRGLAETRAEYADRLAHLEQILEALRQAKRSSSDTTA